MAKVSQSTDKTTPSANSDTGKALRDFEYPKDSLQIQPGSLFTHSKLTLTSSNDGQTFTLTAKSPLLLLPEIEESARLAQVYYETQEEHKSQGYHAKSHHDARTAWHAFPRHISIKKEVQGLLKKLKIEGSEIPKKIILNAPGIYSATAIKDTKFDGVEVVLRTREDTPFMVAGSIEVTDGSAFSIESNHLQTVNARTANPQYTGKGDVSKAKDKIKWFVEQIKAKQEIIYQAEEKNKQSVGRLDGALENIANALKLLEENPSGSKEELQQSLESYKTTLSKAQDFKDGALHLDKTVEMLTLLERTDGQELVNFLKGSLEEIYQPAREGDQSAESEDWTKNPVVQSAKREIRSLENAMKKAMGTIIKNQQYITATRFLGAGPRIDGLTVNRVPESEKPAIVILGDKTRLGRVGLNVDFVDIGNISAEGAGFRASNISIQLADRVSPSDTTVPVMVYVSPEQEIDTKDPKVSFLDALGLTKENSMYVEIGRTDREAVRAAIQHKNQDAQDIEFDRVHNSAITQWVNKEATAGRLNEKQLVRFPSVITVLERGSNMNADLVKSASVWNFSRQRKK